MLSALLLTTLYLFLFYTPVAALQVTPGSPCAQHCIDNTDDDPFSAASSSTTASDIVCTDAAFGTEGTGARFRECVECLQKSDKVNGTESDLHWLLYNLRFALSSGDLLEETWEEPCVSCLQSTTDQYYLSNFLSVLKGACAQRPEAGTLLGITGDIFSRDAINTTVATEDSSTSTSDDSGGATSISKTVGSESIPMYSTPPSAGSAYGMGTKERASTSMDTKRSIGADGRVRHEYYDLL
ncbi:hypothetical protein CFO_g516 [Ceratocystis platani]|uniref:Uncharacterized protein n=1 Tax=Ceratocystis fimbriata f. sp. platani TaxID=88771 RepID=A0A0F8B872_CERFI|nr:hypothetical protein CFO_g516 [Ceratocystis platani]